MNPEALSSLFRESLVMLGVVAGPLLGALFVVGLVIGILQSATQVQEPAVAAVPRLATVVVMVAFLGGWMTERLARFLALALERVAERPF